MANNKGPNCFIKLWLLWWKNIRVLFCSICPMIFIVVIFIILPILIMLLRLIEALNSPRPYSKDGSIGLSISDKGLNQYFYSPNNTVLEGLMKKAELDAKACRDANELLSAITKVNDSDTAFLGLLGLVSMVNVGIEFPDSWSDITELPDAFSSSLRLPTKEKSQKLVGLSKNVYTSAFLSAQNSLSLAYIGSKLNKSVDNMTEFKDFPHRQYMQDPYLDFLFPVIAICFILLTVFMTVIIVKTIVGEKELQIKETLNLVGVGNCLQWLGWYVHYFILLLIASAVYTMCWTIPLPGNDFAFLFFTNWSTFLFIIIAYSHSLICFSFMISSFMTSTRRVTMNTVIVLILSYIPVHLGIKALFMDIILSFNPVSALHLLLGGIKDKEYFGVGAQWDNILEITYPGENLCIGLVLLLMLLGSLISLIICLYMEQLRPGSYDMAKPWHFPCTFCCRKTNRQNLLPYMQLFYSWFARSRTPPDEERPDDPSDAERPTVPPIVLLDVVPPKGERRRDPELQLIGPYPQGKSVGIEIKELSKTFGKNEAVKGVTFNIFKDEITVLLGHNGAGKTTLISMLACFTTPTSGTALVNGHDIRTHPRQAQRCIGLCPQHNVLFGNLGVASHIRLFSQLRGLRGKELKEEVAKYLSKLNFAAKKKTSARKLSGGNQRRLSIACALCGGVKVVICDEPSTGLDPASRRDVWRLIIESKQDCSILLTTHQMDDGEVLGDRIVIISDGKLRCMGTLPFLKKQVDASSLLTCETDRKCDVEKLTKFMAGHVSGIRPFRIIGRDVCYKLPQSKAGSFPSLFRDLEKHQKELGVRGFGLSPESLEEIFMNYGAEDFDSRQAGGAEKSEDDDYDGVVEYENHPSCCAHWRAMSVKKFLSVLDYKVYFIILLLLPIIIYVASVIAGNNDTSISKQIINVNEYKGLGISILVSEPKNSTEEARSALAAIKRLVGTDLEIKQISEPVDEYVEEAYSTAEGQREMLFVLCAVSLEDPLIGWVGADELIHAAPMTINLIYNIAAQKLLGSKVSLEVINDPYRDPAAMDTGAKQVLFVMIYLAILLTLLASPIISERTSHMKMQQEVSGLGMFTYWLSHLVFDMLVYLVFSLVLLLLLHPYGPWHHILFVLFLIGLSGLCFVYLLTCLCRANALAIFLILLLTIIVSNIMVILALVSLFAPVVGDVIQGLCYLHPFLAGHFAISKSMFYFGLCSDDNEQAFNNLGLMEGSCISYFASTSRKCVCEHPIMYPESWFLIVTAVFYWALLMFYEYCGCIWYKVKGCCTGKGAASIDDPKVYNEAEKIRRMSKNRVERRALVVKSATKKYCCSALAVNNISFAIRPRACLGLLGHNGAGKTTTFKMIVGEESIDRGEIWISGYSIKMQRRKAIKELGYCPQFDSFFEYFTGRQMLKFFLQLRGVPKRKIQDRIEQLGEEFAFSKHMDKKIKHYSGGTKRKINAAVGCMGKSLICLDEPSSGVDPASRRHVWNILLTQGDKGKALLLTSHSMDEINALCSKVVMLVDGNIHSMGSNQHVKSKSSKGLELKLVLKAKPEDMARVLSQIEDDLQAAYPNASLQERYEFSGRMTYVIPHSDASWADIFALVDRKRGPWQLEDYTLQQPSLENVFVEIEESKKKNARR